MAATMCSRDECSVQRCVSLSVSNFKDAVAAHRGYYGHKVAQARDGFDELEAGAVVTTYEHVGYSITDVVTMAVLERGASQFWLRTKASGVAQALIGCCGDDSRPSL